MERTDRVDFAANSKLRKPNFRTDMAKLLEPRLDTAPVSVVAASGETPCGLHSIVLLLIHARSHARCCHRIQSTLAVPIH